MRFDRLSCIGAIAILAGLATAGAAARPFFDPRADKLDAFDGDAAFAAAPRDPACYAAKLVATGGPAPRDKGTLAVRWAGYSNFELAYNGKIILLDAYFDRGANYPPLGFAAADITRADVILIGHGHFDHMSDAASVGIRTGAVVVGAPLTTDKLAAQQVPACANPHRDGKGRRTAHVRRLHGRTDFGAARPAGRRALPPSSKGRSARSVRSQALRSKRRSARSARAASPIRG